MNCHGFAIEEKCFRQCNRVQHLEWRRTLNPFPFRNPIEQIEIVTNLFTFHSRRDLRDR